MIQKIAFPNPSSTRTLTVPFVDLSRQMSALRSELADAFARTCQRADFILGDEVRTFEMAFANYVGVRHAIGVANGLDALRLTLAALDVGPGDEVILPANTFIATAFAISGVGARPVFVDCDMATKNIDVDLLRQAITSRTKAIMPVHLTGLAADMPRILEIAERHHLAVVEDACQAHGATIQNRPCGAWGTAGCFSFYPGKNLGALGDGGMVTTNDDGLAQRLRRLRHYGQEAKYHHLEVGTNSRLDTLQAAVLNVKLKRLDAWNAARSDRAFEYRHLLEGAGDVVLPIAPPRGSRHVYHLFVIETERRDELQKHLAACGIQTGIHYPVPIHLQPAYADLGYRPGDFPAAERLARRMLSLPMFPELTTDEVHYVADVVQAWFEAQPT